MNTQPHFVVDGDGSPIVFVHGSYATTSTWKKMVEQLRATHRCLSIKLPGHGGAPGPDDLAEPTIDTELQLIEEAVRSQFGARPVHLVGHSYGGVVALALALKGSLPVDQLTLFEPVATWVLPAMGDEVMQAEVDRFLSTYRSDAEAGVPYACGQVIDFWGGGDEFSKLPDFIKDAMAPLTAQNLRHWAICTRSRHAREDLQALPMPTRVVCGSRSNSVAHAIADHLVATIPQAEKFTIEDASHAMVTSHPQDCLAVLHSPVLA